MASTPRLLCARFPHLGLVAARRRHPELAGEPLVLVAADRVVAASPPARAAGVRPGQAARAARQLCPAGVHLTPDTAAVGALGDAVLTALGAESPAVELDDEATWCDLGGRHAAHATEAAWAATVARALAAALGEVPAVGVGSTRLVAWLAAGAAAEHRIRRVPAGEEAAFLAPLPLGALPADPAAVARLREMGVDRVGQVAALSPGDLARQLGPAGVALHRLARGDDGRVLRPHVPPRACTERLVLEGATADREILGRAARHLSERLGERLTGLGVVAGRVLLAVEGETAAGGLERRPPVPAGAGVDLWPAVLGLLGGIDALVASTGPLTALRLEATDLAPAGGRQADLWRRGEVEAGAVAAAVARVCDRFGAASVLRPRLALDPGDLAERRFRWEHGATPDVPVWALPPVAAVTSGAEPATPQRPAAATSERTPAPPSRSAAAATSDRNPATPPRPASTAAATRGLEPATPQRPAAAPVVPRLPLDLDALAVADAPVSRRRRERPTPEGRRTIRGPLARARGALQP